MPKLYPIQQSFAAGEISPFMYGRNDTEAYKSASQLAKNVISDSRGPVKSRAGMRYLLSKTGSDAKLGSFVASDDSSYVIIITASNVSILDVSTLSIVEDTLSSYWTENQLSGIRFVVSPTDDVVYILHPNVRPYKLSVSVAGAWSLVHVNFASQPSDWADASWPSCGAFTEGRLWLGGAPRNPSKFWASKSALYEDFTTGATAADSFNRDIAYPGKIVWMEGVKNLVIGTTTAEFVCSSQDGIMWNEDIQIDRQSSYGSKSVASIQIGDLVTYVSPDGKKLRTLQYDWSKNSWLSDDITFISNHITKNGIRDIAWSQNPDNIMWFAIEDGSFVSLTYDRANQIYGWNSHDTDGQVKDIVSAEYLGSSYTFFAVVRVDGSINIEVASDYSVKMDSWVLSENESKVDVVTGLSHLEGKEVNIVADGAIQPNQTVSSGSILLSRSANNIYVGIGFDSIIKTLPLAQQYAMGNSRSHTKRNIRVHVDLQDSYLPLVNGRRPPVRRPSTPMDEAEGRITDLVDVGNVGFSNNEYIEIKQDLPLPITVLALYAETSVESL